jgi:hypothetical protein
MENETTTQPVNNDSMPLMPRELAKVFYESKIFTDIHSEAQAIIKILAGREMGLTPIQSMNSVYIIDNKIGYETKILLSKLKKSGKYDYKVVFSVKDGKLFAACVEIFKVKGDDLISLGSSTFSILDAARIGLINRTTYKNYPNLMLFYRAASSAMTIYCPDILDGIPLVENFEEIPNTASSLETNISFNGTSIKIGDQDA